MISYYSVIMTTYKIFNSSNPLTEDKKEELVEFLFVHLDQYGDSKDDIRKAISFSSHRSDPSEKITPLGGFALASYNESNITGVVVVNRTGMSGYIPENILVYIAVHKDERGKGLGKELIRKSIEIADGDMALHVEPDNPARFLYEKMGFESKYLEMRHLAANSKK